MLFCFTDLKNTRKTTLLINMGSRALTRMERISRTLIIPAYEEMLCTTRHDSTRLENAKGTFVVQRGTRTMNCSLYHYHYLWLSALILCCIVRHARVRVYPCKYRLERKMP